jgi:hypothetical protein
MTDIKIRNVGGFKSEVQPLPPSKVCRCIYAQPVGEFKRELIATLRHARN